MEYHSLFLAPGSKKSWALDSITAYILMLYFVSANCFILLYRLPWPVCMHTHQMFPPTFMSAADFVVANVMSSSILPARHQAVKLFQSSEVNASKPWYFARWSLWNAVGAYWLRKRFFVWWKWQTVCFEASVHVTECDIYPTSLMACKGRRPRKRNESFESEGILITGREC